METKHTKGEWGYKKFDVTKVQYSYVIQSSNGDTICKMLRDDSDNVITEGANAKLIAAAPELLEALIECLGGVKELNGEFQEGWDETIEKAENAINKATK